MFIHTLPLHIIPIPTITYLGPIYLNISTCSRFVAAAIYFKNFRVLNFRPHFDLGGLKNRSNNFSAQNPLLFQSNLVHGVLTLTDVPNQGFKDLLV